jgi:hypothetical protein
VRMHAASVVLEVLSSPDLWCQKLWPRLDRDSKRALRLAFDGAIRLAVDGAVVAVASPAEGFSKEGLSRALALFPGVRDLTLLRSEPSSLAPLTTASLAGLTSLTVREVGLHGRRRNAHPIMLAWHASPYSCRPVRAHPCFPYPLSPSKPGVPSLLCDILIPSLLCVCAMICRSQTRAPLGQMPMERPP